MNMRDDIELSVLAETGDLVMAERIGFALDYTQEMLCQVLGIPFDFFREPLL